MKAIILSAGTGSRMRPLTNDIPKPLIEVGGKPLILWHIERLKKAGFRDIVINVAYLGYKIIDHLGDGSKYGINIIYSDEQSEGGLETAGGILKALPLLGDIFLVINADIWTDYPYNSSFTLKKNISAHLILVDNPPHNRDGDFLLKKHGQKYTFSGIGYYSRRFFKGLDYGRRALGPLLSMGIKKAEVTKEYYGGRWYDIGTPQRLKDLDKIIFQFVKAT